MITLKRRKLSQSAVSARDLSKTMAYLPVKPGNQGQPEFSSEIEETYINILFLLFDNFDHEFHCNKAEKVQGVS